MEKKYTINDIMEDVIGDDSWEADPEMREMLAGYVLMSLTN